MTDMPQPPNPRAKKVDVNHLILIGTVVAEPKPSELASGEKVCWLELEVERPKTVLAGGTEEHHVLCRGYAARFALAHVKEGDRVYIEGRSPDFSGMLNRMRVEAREVCIL